MNTQEMAVCLWFDDQAEEAAEFYTSLFEDAQINRIARFGKEGFEFHGKPEGTAMTVEFEVNGMKILALNGGPQFKFSEAVSLVVYCETQEEIDRCWAGLTENGEEGPCGWLKDKYGVSWQIAPAILSDYFSDPDPARRSRVEKCMFQMKKFDLEQLRLAYEG